MVIEHCRKQIVCGTDGVKITGKMQVDVLHRDHLRHTAAGRSALYAEHRTERRLPKRNHRFFAKQGQCVRKAYRGCGFPFARRRRSDGGNQNQFALSVGSFFKHR